MNLDDPVTFMAATLGAVAVVSGLVGRATGRAEAYLVAWTSLATFALWVVLCVVLMAFGS